ncbi:MAG TPA: sigma-70 family RNA polymerase sigma factor [Gemmataceae bacterium]|nr:sigma-70 family RNA polymerase sigma factor [Gemmataceae bacterium]
MEVEPAPALDPRGWLDRHGDHLYRFALARVRAAGVAEDLVQETLLAAWQARAGFAGQASERSWLTAILKRKIVDWVRRQVRERALGSPAEDAEEAAFDPFDRGGHWKKRPTDWSRGNPAEHLNRAEFWATLHACLAKLPPRLHDVFVLRYLDEQPGEQVCQGLGLTPANFWVMLHRARLRMSSCLSINWFGDAAKEGRPC